MCGIAGFVSRENSASLSSALKSMASAIAHRGPDGEGFHESTTRDGTSRIGLAHRRLSIIDLAMGAQPMTNEDRTVHIVFNGEIYNFPALREQLVAAGHRFITASDTETIVHAYEEWGTECPKHLRGMFAFAIWDAKRERLFLCRDRFGKKPLFLCESRGSLVFGSEVKAVLSFPGVSSDIDLDSVNNYFSYRYVPAPGTLFKQIHKLMPGCWAVWENGRLQQVRYYQPPDAEPLTARESPDDKVVVDAFLEKLDEAVRIRMIADVPFGAFLSGGIDSSAIVALMRRHSTQPVKTFSVGFEQAEYSELRYSREVANVYGTDHHELIVSENEVMSLLPRLVRYRDAPISEPSDIPIYMLASEARKSVKMVLTGEGADEFLGGYPKHVYEHMVSPYQVIPKSVRRGLIEPLVHSLPYGFQRAKTAIVNLGLESYQERMPRWFGAMTQREKDALLRPDSDFRPPHAFCGSKDNSPLRRILHFDQTIWLPDNLLERGDSMTMAASLEARMPFLDHELAAMVSALPDRYRVRGTTTKWILREAMKKLLPESILKRPKVGFRVPVNEWFRHSMRDYLFDHLTGSRSLTADYYRKSSLDKILNDHVAGRQNHEKLLWSLLNLEIWHRAYIHPVESSEPEGKLAFS